MEVGNEKLPKALIALLDSGASHTSIKEQSLPKMVQYQVNAKQQFKAVQGVFHSNKQVEVEKLTFPEFTRSLYLKQLNCRVFNDINVEYDIIIGRDILSKAGLKLDFETETVVWLNGGLSIAMKPSRYWKESTIRLALFTEPRSIHEAFMTNRSTTVIKDADYHQVSVEQVVEEQTHLSTAQRNDLYKLLLKHTRLFDGKLQTFCALV